MKNPKYQKFLYSKEKVYVFILRAANGHVILEGNVPEGNRKKRLDDLVSDARTHGVDDSSFKKSGDGGRDDPYTFILKEKSDAELAWGGQYTTRSSRDNGIKSVKTNAGSKNEEWLDDPPENWPSESGPNWWKWQAD